MSSDGQSGANAAVAELSFLDGGGETGALMRARDWTTSPLGEPGTWPPALRSVVRLMLDSGFAMFVAWGKELGFLYNDAYAEILGAKHPQALGGRFHDIWSEIWDDISPLIDAAMAGDASYFENLPLTMNRKGFDEQTWFTFSYSPIRDENGAVAGMFCACTETTGQVLAERRLVDSEREMRFTLKAGRFGAWSLDLATGELTTSETCRANFGRDPDAPFTYAELRDSIHPDDAARMAEAVERSVATGADYDIDYRIVTPAGETRWVAIRAQPTYADDGAPRSMAGVSIDVTDRKESEQALRATAEALHAAHRAKDQVAAERDAILKQLTEGVIVTDGDGRIVFANDRAESLHGVAKLDVAPDEYSDTYHLFTEAGEPYPPDQLPLTRAALHGETVLDARWRIHRPDGTEVLVIGSAHPLAIAGERAGGVLTLRDDTDRREMEIALRDSEQRYRALFEAIDEGFCVIEFIDGPHGAMSDYIHVEANPAYLGNAGIADIVGKRLREIVSDTEADGWAAIYRAVLVGGEPVRFERELVETGRHLELAAFRIEPPERRQVAVLFQDITARKKAEAALRESEARFRAMADSAPAPVWVTTADGIAFANKAFGEIAGMPPEDITGKVWAGMIHPDDRPMALELRAKAWAERTDYAFDARFRRHDGALLWMRVTCRTRFDAAGALIGFVGIAFDITSLRAAEIALRESEERLRIALAAGALGDWEWDVETDVITFSEQAASLFGLPPGPVGTWAGLQKLVDPADSPEATARVEAAVAAGEDYNIEFRLKRPDGQAWINALGRPVMVGGKARGVIGVVQDITARKQAEAALKDLNETLERRVAERTKERDRLWTLSEDMLARADYTGMMSAVNPAWGKVLGWSEHKLLTTGYAEFMHPDDAGATLAAIEAMGQTGQPTRFQNRILTAGGDWTWIDWTVAPEPDGVNFIAVGRDLTDDKAREKELELAQEALRQAQKMETLGQLTGGVAHDFNNLLQIVSGNIGLIQRALPEGDAKLRRAADNAARGAERAAVLTQRLLAFSRRQPLAPKAIDPNKLVGGMSDLLHRTLGETVEIETVLSPRVWPVEADPHQLENAILNLAINGRDAMPDGGKLTIETCNTHLDRAYVAQNAEVSSGQYVCISVTDGGAGMDPDTVARAFEPFFTTKDVGKGTGLGLSMVYGFVKQSGGHLKIYSERGEGTTVKIYLPRLIGAQPETGSGEEELAPEGGQDETILVCEDDADVRTYTVEVLRELGYRVLEAEDGPSALSLLERSGQIDLLFTDVVLPNGMTGAVLAREAQARRPGLKVLYTTGYARNAIVHHGRLDAGVELITKPFSYADLAARVRDILDGQQ